MLQKRKGSLMEVFVFILEWVVSFFVLWGLSELGYWGFKKKMNPMTSAILTFIILCLGAFLFASYIITFPHVEWVFLPIVLFWFIVNLIRANREMK